jgi:hypothetical protein
MNAPRTPDHMPPAEFASDARAAHNRVPLARRCMGVEQQTKVL